MLDSKAQKDLDLVILLRNKPINTLEDWEALEAADRVVSSWIEHGRITVELKKKMTEVLREVESYMLTHPMLKTFNPAAWHYQQSRK